MKVLRKEIVKEKGQVEHTKAEREILAEIKHPFLMGLHYAFQTKHKLYMVMDYMPGGELYIHLRTHGLMDEPTAKFYVCEIVLALEHLHQNKIIYRDLKPENVLIGKDGHIKLTDFGLSKKVEKATYTFCGTAEYLAPEIIRGTGHDMSVDWWALGTLMYEMIMGKPPFCSDNRQETLQKIVEEKPVFPDDTFSTEASDLLS